MSLITDIRAVSENAIEQLAARFSDLPRPLLAAIGAGDMAIVGLADLRESLIDSFGERAAASPLGVGDVRSAVSDLPAKAQKVAADVAGSIEQFASDAPARAQEMIAQFPDRFAEFQTAAQSLSPDAFRETLEAYTQLVGMIYGSLATRGDKTWSKMMAAGMRPGTIVDAVPARPRPPMAAAADPVARAARRKTPTAVTVTTARPTSPRSAAPKPTPVPTAAPGAPARRKPGSAASGPAVKSVMTPKSAAKPATPKSAATPATPATPKSAAKPATPKSAAKPATPKSAAKPATPKSAATPEPIVISSVVEN